MSREHDIVQKLRESECFYDGGELDLETLLAVIARLAIRIEDLESRFEVHANAPRTLVVSNEIESR